MVTKKTPQEIVISTFPEQLFWDVETVDGVATVEIPSEYIRANILKFGYNVSRFGELTDDYSQVMSFYGGKKKIKVVIRGCYYSPLSAFNEARKKGYEEGSLNFLSDEIDMLYHSVSKHLSKSQADWLYEELNEYVLNTREIPRVEYVNTSEVQLGKCPYVSGHWLRVIDFSANALTRGMMTTYMGRPRTYPTTKEDIEYFVVFDKANCVVQLVKGV